MKIRQEGAELFNEDRRTAMTKLIIAFRDFVNAPNNDPKLRSYETPFPLSLLIVYMKKNRPGFCNESGEIYNLNPFLYLCSTELPALHVSVKYVNVSTGIFRCLPTCSQV